MSSKLSDLPVEISLPSMSDIMYLVSNPTTTKEQNKVSLSRLGGALNPLFTTGRVSVVSGNAVPAADQTGKGTLYYTSIANDGVVTNNPFHAVISDGTRLREYTSNEISLAVSIAAGEQKDIYLYDNAGAVAMEASAAWTDAVTRAQARAAFLGQLVKSGTTSRRYVATIKGTGTNTIEDSVSKRFLYNGYNQIDRTIAFNDPAGSWTYTDPTVRQWNGNSANKAEFVLGDPGIQVLGWQVMSVHAASNAGAGASSKIALDSVTAFTSTGSGLYVFSTSSYWTGTNALQSAIIGTFCGAPGLGYHYLAGLESGGDGTCLFLAGPVSGFTGRIRM